MTYFEITCHARGCQSNFDVFGSRFHHHMVVDGTGVQCPVCKQTDVRTVRQTDARFALGQIVMTPTISTSEAITMGAVLEALRAHGLGDWGRLDAEDVAANEQAICDAVDTGDPSKVLERQRVMSVWGEPDEQRFWIITEAGRHATTVLRPEDY